MTQLIRTLRIISLRCKNMVIVGSALRTKNVLKYIPLQKVTASASRIGSAGVVGGIVAGCLSGVLMAATTTTDILLAQADELYDAMKYQNIYDLLSEHRNSKDADILWRLGRATYERAKATGSEAERKILYREALDHVEAALAINPNNFAVHKWMSILLDIVYGYEGTKARIAQSFNVKDHMIKACELNPGDGTSRHILGLWYFNVASIPWYQRNIAAVIFATPPSATFEEALEHFLLAEQLEPNFYSKNLLMIGKCYMQLGKLTEAKDYIQRTKNYTIKTQDDREAVTEADSLLNKL